MFLQQDGAQSAGNAALRRELEDKVAAETKRARRETRISALYWFGGFSLITLISFVLDLYSMAALGQSLVVPLLAGLEVAENNVLAPCVLHANGKMGKTKMAHALACAGEGAWAPQISRARRDLKPG